MANLHPGNVVKIHEHAAFTRRFSPAGAARLLHDCNERALERITVAVARALDNVDDALFALADKAGTDVLQGHYFDAMREVRLKRREIEDGFKREFTAAAGALIARRGEAPAGDQAPALAEAGLSLVEHDDLEEALAISALTDKLEALCHGELFALRERTRFLLDRDAFDNAALPVGPKTVCTAFKSACTAIESGVDIKIIVFKLFDRYVCETLQTIYHEINDYLAGNGVLPKVAARIRNGEQTRMLTGLQQMNGDDLSGGEPDFLAAFAQLLAGAGNGGGNGTLSGGLMPGIPMRGVPVTAAPTLLQDLTLLQQGRWEALEAQGIAVDPALFAAGTTNVVRILKDNGTGDQGEGMVMEVVALLFDYIFDNAGIPDRAKALIGRLQIPTLKVAMLDKTFFSKRHHPARRLLNTLAHATVGLHDERAEESALYRTLEECIQKVQMEFDTDIAVFETVLKELEAYLAQQEDRLSENVAEARKLMQGRERLKIAESLAEAEIEQRLADKPYPQFIRSFALEKWKNLLLVAYMKEGRESEDWKTRLETLDLLIWSTLPKASLKDKRQLVEMLPTLISAVEQGMKLLALDEREQSEFLEKLANCHARAVNEAGSEPLARPAGLNAGCLPNENEAAAADDAAPAAPAAGARQLGDMLVEDLPLLDGSAPLPEDGTDGDERLLVDIDPFATNDTGTVGQDEYAELVSSLTPGVWLEFYHDGGKRVERLSWVSAVLGSYLFTDHDGMKTRELSANELKDALRDGRAAVADDMSLLVDRSLSALLDDMQKKIAG
jgi:hypothetical protein